MKTDFQTYGIKLSEIRPCDNCGGKLVPIFHVIEIRMAVFNPQNVNAVLGTNMIFGGRALGLAEVMAPGADKAIEVVDDPECTSTAFVCNDCYGMKDLNFAILAEKANRAKEKIASNGGNR